METFNFVGFHPVFNKKFEFDLSVPELAVVEFQVMDYESITSNVLVAQCCLPFTSIMPGILFVTIAHKSIDTLLTCFVVTKYPYGESRPINRVRIKLFKTVLNCMSKQTIQR